MKPMKPTSIYDHVLICSLFQSWLPSDGNGTVLKLNVHYPWHFRFRADGKDDFVLQDVTDE